MDCDSCGIFKWHQYKYFLWAAHCVECVDRPPRLFSIEKHKVWIEIVFLFQHLSSSKINKIGCSKSILNSK